MDKVVFRLDVHSFCTQGCNCTAPVSILPKKLRQKLWTVVECKQDALYTKFQTSLAIISVTVQLWI